MFNFTEEELENRTAINKALKRRWSTDSSSDSLKISKAQQKIRRFSTFEAEGLFCTIMTKKKHLDYVQIKNLCISYGK